MTISKATILPPCPAFLLLGHVGSSSHCTAVECVMTLIEPGARETKARLATYRALGTWSRTKMAHSHNPLLSSWAA